MPDLVSDGANFQCDKGGMLELKVMTSSSSADSKKLAAKGNCLLMPQGGFCSILGAPCSIPVPMVADTGQEVVEIDGNIALGKACQFQCSMGGKVSVQSTGQTIAKHDEADAPKTIWEKAKSLINDGLKWIEEHPEIVETAVGVLQAVATKGRGGMRGGAMKPRASSPRARASNPPASAPVGSKRAPHANSPNQRTRNTPKTIRGRSYSGHALDQMENRGIPPRVVDNTIKTGNPTERIRNGVKTTNYYDNVNDVTVVTNDKGGVITVGHGKIGR